MATTPPTDTTAISLDRVLVLGLGLMGEAVVRALTTRSVPTIVVEDRPTDRQRDLAAELGLEFHEAPNPSDLESLLAAATAVVPSPGVPESHPVFSLASRLDRPIISEFDLAARWDDRPLAAITGTNGKTTVTMLVTEMMRASGLVAEAVGNTEVPLVAAIDDAATDVFIVEASSFRLGHSARFRPRVGTWLNFAPDHLDVHASLAVYERAKARIWQDQCAGDLAVANAEDPVVLGHHREARARRSTFGLAAGDYRRDGNLLVAPEGPLVPVDELWSELPHDQSNALAAAATAFGVGANLDGVRAGLRSFRGLAHRVQFIAEHDDIRYFDDSKATAPHATAAAVAGFASVVLIAGGRNKGLDLGVLASGADRLRSVVAIGEAADEVERAFHGIRPVARASSMGEAVDVARRAAQPGDVVLLSPGCASFDWYGSYGERGDDFSAEVRRLTGGASR